MPTVITLGPSNQGLHVSATVQTAVSPGLSCEFLPWKLLAGNVGGSFPPLECDQACCSPTFCGPVRSRGRCRLPLMLAMLPGNRLGVQHLPWSCSGPLCFPEGSLLLALLRCSQGGHLQAFSQRAVGSCICRTSGKVIQDEDSPEWIVVGRSLRDCAAPGGTLLGCSDRSRGEAR